MDLGFVRKKWILGIMIRPTMAKAILFDLFDVCFYPFYTIFSLDLPNRHSDLIRGS